MAENAINETITEQTPKKKMGIGQIIVWSAVALILIFVAVAMANSFIAPPEDRAAPKFTMPLYNNGGTFNLADHKSKNVVVINFWASWCAPCAEEAPNLERAWQDYKDQGVQFVGVDYVDAEAKGNGYIEKYGITYPNGADLGTKISDAYRIRGVPETFIVNRKGNVVFYAPRPLSYDELAAAIEKALAD